MSYDSEGSDIEDEENNNDTDSSCNLQLGCFVVTIFLKSESVRLIVIFQISLILCLKTRNTNSQTIE